MHSHPRDVYTASGCITQEHLYDHCSEAVFVHVLHECCIQLAVYTSIDLGTPRVGTASTRSYGGYRDRDGQTYSGVSDRCMLTQHGTPFHAVSEHA